MSSVTIQAKTIGRRGALLNPLILELDEPAATLRALLAAVVRQQVEAFVSRKSEAGYLRILTESALDSGVAAGRIATCDQEPDARRPDLVSATEAAITAFQDGFYFVFVNDTQVEDLDQRLDEIRTILFVRLTPLAGG